MPDDTCSITEFETLVQPLIGLTVALSWKGYGSTVFLALGELTLADSKWGRRADGEACISVEWDWRVERGATVLYGSSSSGPQIERGICGLQGSTVEGISVVGAVPELTVSFSGDYCLRSMLMTAGDPRWSVKVQDGRWIYARGGELLVGAGEPDVSEAETQAFAVAERTAARWGNPLAEPVRGECRQCISFVPIDGEGRLLDYGVCISSESPFDGKAVKCTSGCPAHTAVRV